MMTLNCETCVGDGGHRRSMGMHQKRRLKEIPGRWVSYEVDTRPLGTESSLWRRHWMRNAPDRKRSTTETTPRRAGRRLGVLAILPRVSVRRLLSIVFSVNISGPAVALSSSFSMFVRLFPREVVARIKSNASSAVHIPHYQLR